MDVRQLATLVAIADHGTFSAAARALYTVQSNVSSHIARLEKELGVTLVDRSQGGLTDDGARVVERARRILNEIDDISADMSSRHADVAGQTRIGVIGTTARWLIPRLLNRLADEHPQVRVIVQEGATSHDSRRNSGSRSSTGRRAASPTMAPGWSRGRDAFSTRSTTSAQTCRAATPTSPARRGSASSAPPLAG